MKFVENIFIALNNVRSNLLRTIITMLIIAFGITALVGILTSIDSMIYSMNDSFSNMEANSFRIQPKRDGIQVNRKGRRSVIGDVINFKQAMEFKDRYDYPARISVYCKGTSIGTAKYGAEKTNPNVEVWGVDNYYLDVKSYEVEVGRNFSETEVTSGQSKAIVGSDIVKALFNENPDRALGSVISVGNIKYKIIGVLSSKGSSMGANQDRRILIPLLKAKTLYGHSKKNYTIAVALSNVEKIDDAISTAIGTFRNIRNLRLAQENDFEITKSDGLLEILKDNTVTVRLSAIGIALITLLGAAIGLMNIMLVSVTERTREIGICKALGATRKNILTQFLTEAVVICQLGGLVGIVFGILIGNIVTFFIGGTFLIPWAWITLGVTTCLFVGLISGLYPALKAARLDPIESLRYE
ncbi:MAG: ABC transporter permease [Bacteroidota bacterium]